MNTASTKFINVWRETQTYVKFIFVIAIIIGICLRFVNIDYKVYWSDEAFTSLRISGYTEKELFEHDFQGNVITVEDFRKKYQEVNEQKNVTNTVIGLGQEEAQLTPLYFVMVRIWSQLFGSGIWSIRLLSVIFSLISIAGIYWLCLELFKTHLAGQIAAILMSVSPFQVLFAQEARPYSLWTLMILLSSVAILRAMRLQNKLSWWVYSFTVALSLYTFLFSGFVIAGHGLYVLAIEKIKLTKNVTAYLRASIFGAICFLPWILILIFNVHRSYKGIAWLGDRFEAPLFQRWIVNLGISFIDFGTGLNSHLTFFYCLPIALLLASATYFVCRHKDKNVKFFVAINTFFMIIFLGLTDIVLKGQRSAITRYMIPFYIGAQISITYLFTYKLTEEHVDKLQRQIWRSLLAIISILGIVSCLLISQSSIWWNKGLTANDAPLTMGKSSDQKVIDSINLDVNSDGKLKRKLIISNSDSGKLMAFSHSLDPKVNLLFLQSTDRLYNVPKYFDDIMLYSPSESLLDSMKAKKTYKLSQVNQYGSSSFWKVEIVE